MDYTTPILALLLGWLLSEGSHLLRYRSQKRQCIRLCLVELLEIRHRVIGNQFLFKKMQEHLELNASQLLQVRSMLPKPLQSDPEASRRLSVAIGKVAMYAPFLAYKLRGKDVVNTVEHAFNPEGPQEDQFAEHLLKAQREFRESIIPELDQAVLITAWHSGWMDWFHALKLVRRVPGLSPEVEEMTNSMLESMRAQLKAPQES